MVRRLAPEATVVETGHNAGFPAGCNLGAAQARNPLLVFLNPDAVPQAGWGAAIRAPLGDGAGWAAWQALVTQEHGAAVNTAGNVVHFTGVAWAGQAGVALARADLRRREVGYLSGACFAVRRDAFDAVGGFDASYFLYHEDLDLSLRLRLAGGRLGVEPDARVEHDYEFVKGDYKWELMERNRWATLVRTWPGPVLALVAPALLATEARDLARRGRRRLGRTQAPGDGRRAALAAALAPRAGRDPGGPRDLPGGVRPLARRRPLERLPRRRGADRAAARRRAALLARRARPLEQERVNALLDRGRQRTRAPEVAVQQPLREATTPLISASRAWSRYSGAWRRRISRYQWR